MSDVRRIAARIKGLLPAAIRSRMPKRVAIYELRAPESQRLNMRFRKKDYATNVLTFCYSPEYAEILLCPAVIRREAKEAGNSFRYQMTWMILHGILHSAGMHHESSRGVAVRSERMECGILTQLFRQTSPHVHLHH